MDIEVAGRELARRDLERHPGKLMDQLTQYPREARLIALKMIQGQSCLPGFKLSERSLKEIAKEIEGFFGIIRSENDFPTALPKLYKYLASVKILKDDTLVLGTDQKLIILAARMRQLFELDMPLPGKDGAFERVLMSVTRDEAIERQAQRVRAQREGDPDYHKALELDLRAIVHFWRMSEFSKMVIASYDDLKRWRVRALDISSEDADRMMKYQSMLERRISTAIGELLELQKLRK